MELNGFIVAYIVVAAIVLFVILRELTLWYFKINKIVDLLSSIDQKLDSANGMGNDLCEEDEDEDEDSFNESAIDQQSGDDIMNL